MDQKLNEILEIINEGKLIVRKPTLYSQFFNLGLATVNENLLKMISERSFDDIIEVIINETLVKNKYQRDINMYNRYNKGDIEHIESRYKEDLIYLKSIKEELSQRDHIIYEKFKDLKEGSFDENFIELEYYKLGKIYASKDKDLLNRLLQEDIPEDFKIIVNKCGAFV